MQNDRVKSAIVLYYYIGAVTSYYYIKGILIVVTVQIKREAHVLTNRLKLQRSENTQVLITKHMRSNLLDLYSTSSQSLLTHVHVLIPFPSELTWFSPPHHRILPYNRVLDRSSSFPVAVISR